MASVVDIGDTEKLALTSLGVDVQYVGRKRNIVGVTAERPGIQVVLDGWAARYVDRRSGTRRIVSFLLPGEHSDIEEVALQNGEGVVALTDCWVAYFNREQLEIMSAGTPNLLIAFWRLSARDNLVMRRWMTLSAKSDATSAIAHLLCELYYRARETGIVEANELKLPLTQEDLANALSLTSVHVNRSLRKLRERGLCILDQGRLIIHNMSGLEAVGQFDAGYL